MQVYQSQHDFERADYEAQHQQQYHSHNQQQQYAEEGYSQHYDEPNSEDEVAYSLRQHQDGPVDEEIMMEGNEEYMQHEQHQGVEGDEHGHEHEHEHDDDSGSFSDSLSSSPSIPDEDIDFSLVYALHTFLRTVDGQASVVKGDKLLLLDDSNSYWWLVRVLKTQAVGYIPAENIETPWERLARLNKHRNVDLTSATQHDLITGPSSTTAQTRFAGRIPPSQQPHPHESQHPSSKGVLASPSHKDHPRNMSPSSDRYERPSSSKAKTVLFTAPVYYEHSANGESDDEEYDQDMMGEDGEMQGQQTFEDDGEESEFSDDDDADNVEEGTDVVGERRLHQSQLHRAQDPHTAIVGEHDAHDQGEQDWRPQEEGGAQQPQQQQLLDDRPQRVLTPVDNLATLDAPYRALSPAQQESLHRQQLQRELERQHAQKQEQQPTSTRSAGGSNGIVLESTEDSYNVDRRPSGSSSGSIRGREINDNDFEPNAPTKKLTATPPIVRDPNFDINDPFGDLPGGKPSIRAHSPQRVRSVELVDVADPRYERLIGGNRPRRVPEVAASTEQHQQQQQQQQQQQRQQQEHQQSTATDLQQQQRPPSHDYGNDADMSLNSMETASSLVSGQSMTSAGPSIRSSDDGHRTETPTDAPNLLISQRKSKKGRNSVEAEGEKKRKSGGILGLFRKKDKKRKDNDGDARSSEESARVMSPSSDSHASPDFDSSKTAQRNTKRESLTAESMFSTDAALRQQHLEAKQAMFHQYGVQRGPGDVSNTMTPKHAPQRTGLGVGLMSPTTGGGGLPSPTLQAPAHRMRPGSLLGSPSIPGLDVPLLSVLRVFAGSNVEAKATFKTVLLNRSTTASDLVKQSMQRFRLVGNEEVDQYFLTIKELGGEERALADDQKPLEIFEQLSQQAQNIPSVKRSSIGSIDSVSSNLSLNPAITRLGMNDWSDDSAVKFYLNRRLSNGETQYAKLDDGQQEVLNSTDDSPALKQTSGQMQGSTATPPSYRFAVKIRIHPSDLPENVVFDPQTNAIVPKATLQEREQRSGHELEASTAEAREKIVFFPRNVTVSDVIEAGLDRFGIVDGVVDGGDEVEDRVSKRRSVTRVKYGLAVEKDGREVMMNASGKLLEAYTEPPIFKSYDRSSKEFRRRSVDATLILGAPQDVRSSDPIFVIRRAAMRAPPRAAGPMPVKIGELEERQQNEQAVAPQRSSLERDSNRQTASDSDYATANEAEGIVARGAAPQATRQEIIAAQRAVSRAKQRALLSAQKNEEQGFDITIPERGTIRSSRGASDDKVRYSFVDQEGTQTDISEIVHDEWRADATRSKSDSAVDAAETRQAPASPRSDDDDEEERAAVAALRDTRVDIDSPNTIPKAAASVSDPPREPHHDGDVLQDALGPRSVTSPVFGETLQDRLDRVLAKVKEDKAAGKRPPSRPRSFQLAEGASSPSGRMSPASSLGGRRSPFVDGRNSPSIEQVVGGRGTPLGSSTTRGGGGGAFSHGKKPSIASVTSTHSSNTDQLSTPVTTDSHHGFAATPITSNESRETGHAMQLQPAPSRSAFVYNDDFGLETLMTLVDAAGRTARQAARRQHQLAMEAQERSPVDDSLFGRSIDELALEPRVRRHFEPQMKKLDEFEARLDQLLLEHLSMEGSSSSSIP